MTTRTKVTLSTLLLLFFLLLPVSADQTLSSILQKVREKYENLPGLTLTYQREIISASMSLLGEKGNRDLATGLIYFKPPYFLRIDQKTPRIETVISDGELLWWYIPEKNEVYRYSMQRSAPELKLMSDIFQGLKQVEESFIVSLSEKEQTENIRIKLIPQPAWPQTESIIVSISPDDYRILAVEIHDYMGGMTRFTIQKQTVRKDFGQNFFRFEIPKGARVIEGEG
jgi:outer membrane lipoprotein-sorting protein